MLNYKTLARQVGSYPESPTLKKVLKKLNIKGTRKGNQLFFDLNQDQIDNINLELIKTLLEGKKNIAEKPKIKSKKIKILEEFLFGNLPIETASKTLRIEPYIMDYLQQKVLYKI